MSSARTFVDEDGDTIEVAVADFLPDIAAHVLTTTDGVYLDRITAPEVAIAILRAASWTGEITLGPGGLVSVTT